MRGFFEVCLIFIAMVTEFREEGGEGDSFGLSRRGRREKKGVGSAVCGVKILVVSTFCALGSRALAASFSGSRLPGCPSRSW